MKSVAVDPVGSMFLGIPYTCIMDVTFILFRFALFPYRRDWACCFVALSIAATFHDEEKIEQLSPYMCVQGFLEGDNRKMYWSVLKYSCHFP